MSRISTTSCCVSSQLRTALCPVRPWKHTCAACTPPTTSSCAWGCAMGPMTYPSLPWICSSAATNPPQAPRATLEACAAPVEAATSSLNLASLGDMDDSIKRGTTKLGMKGATSTLNLAALNEIEDTGPGLPKMGGEKMNVDDLYIPHHVEREGLMVFFNNMDEMRIHFTTLLEYMSTSMIDEGSYSPMMDTSGLKGAFTSGETVSP